MLKYAEWDNYGNTYGFPIEKNLWGARLNGGDPELLEQRFFEVWVVGNLGKEFVEKLKEKLSEAYQSNCPRIRFRFYYDDPHNSLNFEAIRSILLENTRLSVVIEERSLETLESDLRSLGGEVSLLVSRELASSMKFPKDSRLKLVEV